MFDLSTPQEWAGGGSDESDGSDEVGGAIKAEVIKWAFVFWVPTALGVIGLYFRG